MSIERREKYTILLFVKSPGNRKVISECIEEEGYECYPVPGKEEMERIFGQPEHKLALVDASGYGPGVWRLCERLHEKKIPFIVLSPQESLVSSSRAAAYGAVSVLQKPIATCALVQLLAGFMGNGEERK